MQECAYGRWNLFTSASDLTASNQSIRAPIDAGLPISALGLDLFQPDSRHTARRSRSRRLWLSLSELVDRDAINCRQIQAE